MSHVRCIVGRCNNDKKYLERMIVHRNVKYGKLVFYKLPANEERQKACIHLVG